MSRRIVTRLLRRFAAAKSSYGYMPGAKRDAVQKFPVVVRRRSRRRVVEDRILKVTTRAFKDF